MSRVRRTLAALILSLIGVVGIAAAASVTPQAAFAAGSDSYDSFNIDYVVDSTGVVHVTETFTYNFSSSSKRHGYDRILVTGEAHDASRNIAYTISNVTVTSPDPVSTEVSRTDYVDGRNSSVRLRIGSASQTIKSTSVRYVIRYDLGGALRPFADHDEFYWDALGPGLGVVKSARVTVTVPQGVQDAVCYSGYVQSTTPCTSHTITPTARRHSHRSHCPQATC